MLVMTVSGYSTEKMYLLAGEIPMHLLYGFGPLVGQDTLKKGHSTSSTRINIKHDINVLWTY